jgi:tetratricopeptide (TPR) repeat protein
MKRRLAQITIVMLGVVIGVLTNVATGELPNMLPPAWKSYLWLSWAPLGVSVLAVIVLEWRASRDEHPISTGDTIKGDKLDIQGAQNVIVRPSGPVAQVNSGTIEAASDDGKVHVNVAIGVGENDGSIVGVQHIYKLPTATPALHQLRAPVSDFIGRDQEIDQLVEVLSKADGSAAAISGVRGMGGIGKTELAYAVANRLNDAFPDAQLLIELRGASSSPLTPEQALQTVIRAFDWEAKLPDDLGQLQSIYRDKLSGKQVLILADDAKDIVQVRSLFPPSGCALLMTSRNKFNLPGMVSLDLEALSATEAEELLLKICPRMGEHVGELARMCSYLPLALRISASILKENDSKDVRRYVEQLRIERLKHLRDPDYPDDPQASVETCLRLSYDALEAVAKKLLCELSVFPTSFDLEAAKIIVKGFRDMEGLLELLCRRNLLEWDRDKERYSLHDLVRVFAAARTNNPYILHLQHAQYYLQVARTVDELSRKGGEHFLLGLTLFEQERIHIEEGWLWATKRKGNPSANELLQGYALSTAHFGMFRFSPRERIARLETAIGVTKEQKQPFVAFALMNFLGNAYHQAGDPRRSIEFNERALTLARANHDRVAEEKILSSIAQCYTDLDDTHRAIEYIGHALTIAEENRDGHSKIMLLTQLGRVYSVLRDEQSASEYYTLAVTAAQSIGVRDLEANALAGLGRLYFSFGDIRKAITYYKRSLSDNPENGQPLMVIGILDELGEAYFALGNSHDAIMTYEQEISISRKFKNLEGELIGLCHQVRVLYAIGEIKHALLLCDQSLKISHIIDDPRDKPEFLNSLGVVYTVKGDVSRAVELHEQALVLLREARHQ